MFFNAFEIVNTINGIRKWDVEDLIVDIVYIAEDLANITFVLFLGAFILMHT